ncbi:Fc.00g092300.m01.CDS01 [Cosmosporella sp. VM-42]
MELLVLRSVYDECTDISPRCPVEATVLGYTPNLGSSIFFALCFGLITITAAVLSVWKRTWTYGAALTVGVGLEALGYIGRALMHDNPWASGPFQMQICCIIIAPTFICASIYLTLKHVALNLNPSLSRLPPTWYPRIFLPGDLSCLVVQAIGGGIASAAGETNPKLSRSGNQAIIAGVALQVAVLAIFGAMSLDYYLRVRKFMASGQADGAALSVWRDAKFRRFGYAVMGAYAAVLVRCVYRIAEMAGGWGNHIMQDEPSFLVLDSTLVLVATFLLTAFHPGLLFPQMRNGFKREEVEKTEAAGESSNEGTKMEGGSV